MRLEKDAIQADGVLKGRLHVRNAGNKAGTEIVQFYVQDVYKRQPHGIAVPPPEKRQNLYGWSRSWFVSSVIAVLRGAASHYLAEYGGKRAAGTIMQFLTDLLQRFVCSC